MASRFLLKILFWRFRMRCDYFIPFDRIKDSMMALTGRIFIRNIFLRSFEEDRAIQIAGDD
jgi:hypothetical protein